MREPGDLLRGHLSHDYLHADYLRDFQRDAEHERDNFKKRFIRRTLLLLSYVCHVDVCANSRETARYARPADLDAPTYFRWPRSIECSQWYKARRFAWISELLLYLYLWFNFHHLINMLYQYTYDFDHLRLIHLRQLRRQGRISHDSFSQTSINLLQRIEETRATLALIGAPHAHMSISIECLYWFVILCTFILYYLCYLYYKFGVPFDFHFIRGLLEPENELRNSNALVEEQMGRFIESHRAFTKILARFFDDQPQFGWHQWEAINKRGLLDSRAGRDGGAARNNNNEQKPARLLAPGGPGGLDKRAQRMLKLAQDECRVYSILTRMLASGALRPFNKSPAWARRLENLIYNYHVINFTYMMLFLFILLKSSFDQRNTSSQLSCTDWAMTCSTVGIMMLMLTSINLYCVYFLAGSIDQVVMVNKMRELILSCVQSNTWQHLELARSLPPADALPAGGQPQNKRAWPQVDKMNTNYLFVMMHFKIFVAQFEATKRTVQSVMLFVTPVVFLIPVIVKPHLPYLNMFNFGGVRWFASVLSFMSLVPANVCLVPVCHLHARCADLNRAMFSLIAHVIEIESQPAGRGIYDQHAVALLYKELRHTDQFMARFRPRSLGMTSTYNSLIKTNFWWGIVVLAILTDNQGPGNNGNELFNSLFSDPLGVFTSLYWDKH